MAWADELRAEMQRAMADLAGAGLPGTGDATNATLTRAEPGTYDPTTGAASTVSESWSCLASVSTMTERDPDNMQVRTKLRAIIAYSEDFTPADNDTLAVGGTTYSLLNVKPQEIGGGPVSWLAELRV